MQAKPHLYEQPGPSMFYLDMADYGIRRSEVGGSALGRAGLNDPDLCKTVPAGGAKPQLRPQDS